jgi:hypothetical protein
MSLRAVALVTTTLSMLGCAGAQAQSPSEPTRDASTWLAGAPNQWLFLRPGAMRADPVLGPELVCQSAESAAKAKRYSFLEVLSTLPCREAMLAASTLEVWVHREPNKDAQEALVVVRGAAAAAACLEREDRGKELAPNVTERVRFGKRWPRIYVVGTADAATIVMPTGKAAEVTRRGLAQGAPLPVGNLTNDELLRGGGTAALLEVLAEEKGVSVDTSGFARGELAVGATSATSATTEEKNVPIRFDAVFENKTAADAAAPLAAKLGKTLQVRRLDETRYSATGSVSKEVMQRFAICHH